MLETNHTYRSLLEILRASVVFWKTVESTVRFPDFPNQFLPWLLLRKVYALKSIRDQ
jgi:hypothetical protein